MAMAVVTGAGRGIGRAIAHRLAADGFSVVAADPEGAGEVAAELGGRGVTCDVADRTSVQALAESLGSVDVLVNNAGIWRFATLAETTPEDARAVLEVNVLGTLWCTQALAPKMPAGASIVNVGSISARTVIPGVGVYSASKAAVLALTVQSALEYAPVGIRANAVCPGLVPTEGTVETYTDDPAVHEAIGKTLPLGRVGTPADVADVVAFFASDDSRYVTGQVVYVDGGVTEATIPFMRRNR